MIFLLCIAGILGAILGSFASAVLPRIHEKRGFVQERSECPSCHAPLKVLDLFPIFSYLFLGGKCRYCKHAIPPYHFMLEVSMVLMFLGIAWFFGETTPLPSLVFLFAAGFVTIAFCAYDLLYMEIPDGFLLPFLLITFILLAVGNFETLPLFQHFIPFENPTLNSPLVQWMLWGIPIFLFFLLQILVSDGKWMGGWDLRIALFMGFVGGAKIAWLGLFIAYIAGSLIGLGVIAAKGRQNTMIPFGPALAIGLWISMVAYQPLMNWYIGLLTQ